MEFRILDLFCGAGGLSYGIDKNKNFKTVLGLDYVKTAVQTFNYNIKSAVGVVGDITKHEVKSEIISKAKTLEVNMIIGGPPCQGFSVKGKQQGLDDPRNFLLLDFIQIVKEIKPEVFVLENAKNLLNCLDGKFINQINTIFKEMGYIMSSAIMNAQDYGVPQIRERTIIVGSLSRSVSLIKGNVSQYTTVRDAISDLSYLESGEGSEESPYINPSQSLYQERLRGDKLFNHQATTHSALAISKLKMIPPEGDRSSIPLDLHGKQRFQFVWSRLKWDEVSPPIDTRFDTPANGRNSHPFLNRAITPREAARLQSFDDNFKFIGPKTAVCKQIGNAVPPLLAKAIADSISQAYLDKRYSSPKFNLYLADALSLVKELEQQKVIFDHIITDPPYGSTKDKNRKTMAIPRKALDFGSSVNDFDSCEWIKDYVTLLAPSGSIIIFCSYSSLSYIITELEINQVVIKDVIIWKNTKPTNKERERNYVHDLEYAIWGVKDDNNYVFNKPQDVAYLHSIFESQLESQDEKAVHPDQKSLKLMEHIINIHTNPNDVIIDPFMGSGTTGLACLKLGRRFIGIEADSNYYSLSLERLEKYKK